MSCEKPVPTLPTYFNLASMVGCQQQRSEMFAGAGRRSVADDDELVLLLHLELEPLGGAAFHVGRRFVFRDHALESLSFRDVVSFQSVGRQASGGEEDGLLTRRSSKDFLQLRAARSEVARAEIAAIQIKAIEDRVVQFVGEVLQKLEARDAAIVESHHFAIQQQSFVRKSAHRESNGGQNERCDRSRCAKAG